MIIGVLILDWKLKFKDAASVCVCADADKGGFSPGGLWVWWFENPLFKLIAALIRKCTIHENCVW